MEQAIYDEWYEWYRLWIIWMWTLLFLLVNLQAMRRSVFSSQMNCQMYKYIELWNFYKIFIYITGAGTHSVLHNDWATQSKKRQAIYKHTYICYDHYPVWFLAITEKHTYCISYIQSSFSFIEQHKDFNQLSTLTKSLPFFNSTRSNVTAGDW